MSQKILKLKQVKDRGHLYIEDRDLAQAEEGDKVGSYKVVEADEQECDHTERNWSLSDNESESTPTMTGRCTVCGHEKIVEPEEQSE